MVILKLIKKIIFIGFIVSILSFSLYADCSYDWQNNPHWYSSYCDEYYQDWNTCNANDIVCQQQGTTTTDIDEQDFNFLNGLAGLMSALIIWQAWNNANK